MFALFKRNLTEIDSSKYQKLAVSANSNALTATAALLAESSKRGEEIFMLLYNDVLAFAVCLAQMSVQKKFKLKDTTDFVAIVRTLQQQFRELPVPIAVPNAQFIAVTRNMLDNATTDAFPERVRNYACRNYRALAITDDALEAFCKVTGHTPSVIKSAGWTLALLIFQIRVSLFILEEAEFQLRLLPMLATAQKGCQFMMGQFDHILG